MGQEDESAELAQLYPDVVEAGSLPALLRRSLDEAGSSLGVDGTYTFASVMFDRRRASVYLSLEQRGFLVELWENEIGVAKGRTADPALLTSTVRSWMEHDTKPSALIEAVGLLELTDRGVSWEQGTYLEDEWERLEGMWEGIRRRYPSHPVLDDLLVLIRLAAQRPELHRFVPFTSHVRFSVSPKARSTYDKVPLVLPHGGGRYSLEQRGYDSDEPGAEGDPLAEGDVAHVLDALEAFLRENSVKPSGGLRGPPE